MLSEYVIWAGCYMGASEISSVMVIYKPSRRIHSFFLTLSSD